MLPTVEKELITFPNQASQLLNVFLGAGHPGLLRHVDEQGVCAFARLSEQLVADPNALKTVTFRTVFGATEHMPLGGLGYVLPTIQLIEALLKTYEKERHPHQVRTLPLPSIEFVFMTEAGIEIDGFDRRKVYAEARLAAEVAKRYISEFHPRLVGAVHFLDDREFSPAVFGGSLKRLLAEIFPQALANSPELLAKLLAMGEAKGGADLTSVYTGLHVLLHDGIPTDIPGLTSLLGENITEKSTPSLLVSLGCQSEGHFYLARQLLKQDVSDDVLQRVPTAQYLTQQGAPPYDLMQESDITLRAVIADPHLLKTIINPPHGHPGFHTLVQNATRNLIKDCGTPERLTDFFRGC